MFTNRVGPCDDGCIGAVTVMMGLWEACFFVLIVDLTLGKDIALNSTYVVVNIESCPDVGYFFRREPSPNLVGPGPCYLCFCKNNGTADCWQRDQRRCDVEKYHRHRVGRESRYRRSFSDVFFRDATRDFFGKNLAQQCKPHESSFSDGCPPADWCIGCTICDCDSNGQWDCHILSFCDGKESKKKIRPFKNYKGKKAKKSIENDRTNEMKLTKQGQTRKTNKKPTVKPQITKPPKKNVRIVVKAKTENKTNTRTNKAPRNSTTKQRAPKKSTRKTQTKAMSQNHPKNNVSRVKIIKKVVAIRKPVTLNKNAVKGLKLNPNNSDTIKLGQKIVKQVMTTFKKILAKEIDKLNETKRMRLLDGKDCGGVKKRNKRTYNVRSNAISRNKNKYNRQGILKENYTNVRKKREIMNKRQIDIEKISVITLPTDINAVIPLELSKEENITSTNSVDNATSALFVTPKNTNYYKYSIKNDTDLITVTETTQNVTENRENYIESNFVVPVEPKNKLTTAINPDFNDLKFTKWYVIKIKNDERKQPVTRLLLTKPSTTKSFEYRKITDKEYYTSKLQKKKFEPKFETTRKYNFTTLVSKVYRKPCCTTQITTNIPEVVGLKNIMRNFFSEVNKTNTAKRKQKSKISVLRYVRKFFHKMFSKQKIGNHKLYGLGNNEDRTLQILCENIGPCKIKKNNRIILKHKLKLLNKETKIVLKSIRIVKGLLHLLELPGGDKTPLETKDDTFKNDIQKLGTVLKDNKEDGMNSSLTFTQTLQIGYIKKNTQIFIESVKKFANILTDILSIIKPDIGIDHSLKPPQKRQNYTSSLNKIKKILYQYNLMQNTFMKKMYEIIGGEEKRVFPTEIILMPNSTNQNESNNTMEKYAQNIITSLKKMKNLAQILNSTRKKRESTRRDDALDYLLSLMEILIRQNHPVDTAPANDGIDLLIDAIKNAPDIKPVRKMDSLDISHSKPTNYAKASNQQTSDSSSDSKKNSNEENAADSEDNIISQDNVSKQENVLVELGKTGKPETLTIRAIDEDEMTQKVYFRIFNQAGNDYETTTEYNDAKKRINNEVEKIGFDKFESYLGDPKKLEAEAYIEDEPMGDIVTENTSTSATDAAMVNNTDVTEHNKEYTMVTKTITPQETTLYSTKSNESSSESQDSMNYKRAKLEWIEETFDREIRMINNASSSVLKRTSTQPPVTSTRKRVENISDLTKEDHTEQSTKIKGKTSKYNDVLYEKHIQFLNSLDYGATEKSADFEETDSKDDARSDDAFPSYFV